MADGSRQCGLWGDMASVIVVKSGNEAENGRIKSKEKGKNEQGEQDSASTDDQSELQWGEPLI